MTANFKGLASTGTNSSVEGVAAGGALTADFWAHGATRGTARRRAKMRDILWSFTASNINVDPCFIESILNANELGRLPALIYLLRGVNRVNRKYAEFIIHA
jgi:hypothetical protein